MAAQQLGIEEIPTMTARGWTEAQKRAYVIADNQLAMNATWNNEILALELDDLKLDNFDLDLIGFTPQQLELIDSKGNPDKVQEDPMDDEDPDAEAPEPRATLGDVWLLGRHRIVCGDSTDPTTVAKAFNGQTCNLMVTDPPYGVEYDASWRGEKLNPSDRATGEVLNDNQADWSDVWSLYTGDVAYVWHADKTAPIVRESLERNGFEHRSTVIWKKAKPTISRGHYNPQHEQCFYMSRKNKTCHWNNDGGQSSVWEVIGDKLEGSHSTRKPVECMARPMRNNSVQNDVVYDPFLGSGTTLVAAEQLNRICVGIELNPAYVDIALARWERLTGKTATLEQSDGA